MLARLSLVTGKSRSNVANNLIICMHKLKLVWISGFQSTIPGFQGATPGFQGAIPVFQKVREI